MGLRADATSTASLALFLCICQVDRIMWSCSLALTEIGMHLGQVGQGCTMTQGKDGNCGAP